MDRGAAETDVSLERVRDFFSSKARATSGFANQFNRVSSAPPIVKARCNMTARIVPGRFQC